MTARQATRVGNARDEERDHPSAGERVTQSDRTARRPECVRRTMIPRDDRRIPAREVDRPSSDPRTSARADDGIDDLGRRMYQHYLESEFPAALELAESVLLRNQDHHLAHLVAARCRAVLGGGSDAPVLSGSSIIRASQATCHLRCSPTDATSAILLWHVDGVSSLDVIAEVTGYPPAATLGCFQALLELGVVELVP